MDEINEVAVIGAGTMGVDTTIDLLLHGVKVVLTDISDSALQKARDKIVRDIRFVPLQRKELPYLEEAQVLQSVVFSRTLGDIAGCDFVIENTTENWENKAALYRELDEVCPGDICFGVNTSCISITKIASLTRRPEQVIGIHLMNPVFLKDTVEAIKGYHTSEKTVEKTTQLLEKLGKKAIFVKDYPGFVTNKISHLFMNEAAFAVQDEMASAENIDQIFKGCYGHPMGPLETADLIGLDTVVNSLDVLYQNYQDSKYRCCPLLKKMVDAGLLGKKSGQGFYTYHTV